MSAFTSHGLRHLHASLLLAFVVALPTVIGRLGQPADMILAERRRRPDGLARTEIRDLLGRNAGRSRVDESLKLLERLGRVTSERRQKGAGRPVETWRLAE